MKILLAIPNMMAIMTTKMERASNSNFERNQMDIQKYYEDFGNARTASGDVSELDWNGLHWTRNWWVVVVRTGDDGWGYAVEATNAEEAAKRGQAKEAADVLRMTAKKGGAYRRNMGGGAVAVGCDASEEIGIKRMLAGPGRVETVQEYWQSPGHAICWTVVIDNRDGAK
jgi:hypothetical protein